MACSTSLSPASPDLPVKGPRSARRITITVPHRAYLSLLQRSDEEGRSLSNLAAYLLEAAIEQRVSSSQRP